MTARNFLRKREVRQLPVCECDCERPFLAFPMPRTSKCARSPDCLTLSARHNFFHPLQLKAQCDPTNWMYSNPSSGAGTSSSSQPRRASLLLPAATSTASLRSLPTFRPAVEVGKADPLVHNRPADTTSVLPKYLQHIIAHHTHISKPQHDAKLLKKLSKAIVLPEDPGDPAAFTVTPGLTRKPKPPWCGSKPVLKNVGCFVIIMSLIILGAIFYMNCECVPW